MGFKIKYTPLINCNLKHRFYLSDSPDDPGDCPDFTYKLTSQGSQNFSILNLKFRPLLTGFSIYYNELQPPSQEVSFVVECHLANPEFWYFTKTPFQKHKIFNFSGFDEFGNSIEGLHEIDDNHLVAKKRKFALFVPAEFELNDFSGTTHLRIVKGLGERSFELTDNVSNTISLDLDGYEAGLYKARLDPQNKELEFYLCDNSTYQSLSGIVCFSRKDQAQQNLELYFDRRSVRWEYAILHPEDFYPDIQYGSPEGKEVGIYPSDIQFEKINVNDLEIEEEKADKTEMTRQLKLNTTNCEVSFFKSNGEIPMSELPKTKIALNDKLKHLPNPHVSNVKLYSANNSLLAQTIITI